MINLLANLMGIEQWLIIGAVVLLLFGGKKIPELMRGMGRGVGELQKGLEEGKRALHTSINEEPVVDTPQKMAPKPEAVVVTGTIPKDSVTTTTVSNP